MLSLMNANGNEQGGRLRRRRLSAGLSQERVARLADCSTSSVRLLEAGWTPRSQSAVEVRVAAALERVAPAETGPNNGESSATTPSLRETSYGRAGPHGPA